MTIQEDRLRHLLHQAAPEPTTTIDYETIGRKVRGRRRAKMLTSAVAIAAVAVLLPVGLTASQGGGRQTVTATPAPDPTTAPRSVTYQGVSIAPPAGWTTEQASCTQPAHRTVVIGTWIGGCPQEPVTGVPAAALSVRALYGPLSTSTGPQFALGWQGKRITWDGEPAWLLESTQQDVATAVLALPWANALVTARASESASARELLDRVSVRIGDGLAVPATASSVTIESLAGPVSDGQQRRATVTNAADVARLLNDLRSLAPLRSAQQACDGSSLLDTAVLTVSWPGGQRAYAARFGQCAQVIAGTGNAAHTNANLLDDIRRLVPNSGL